MTTLMEHRTHARTVAAYYRPRRMRAEFRNRVISAYERGDLRELEYLRQVRGFDMKLWNGEPQGCPNCGGNPCIKTCVRNSPECGECAHFPRCEMLFNYAPTNTECDWIPSKFALKTTA